MGGEKAISYQFSTERLSRVSQMERWQFWFQGRRALVEQLLMMYLEKMSHSILDVGCGTGYIVEVLTRKGYRVIGVDKLPDGLQATRERLLNATLIQAEVTNLPFNDNGFDAALLLDVLEHVDDVTTLAEVKRVLSPGRIIIITVPAMPWLWSYRDEAAHHLRRYTRRRLVNLIRHVDLHIELLRYYQFILMPIVVMTRLLGRRTPGVSELEEKPGRVINTILTFVNKVETRMGKFIPYLWGSSLVAVCRKI